MKYSEKAEKDVIRISLRPGFQGSGWLHNVRQIHYFDSIEPDIFNKLDVKAAEVFRAHLGHRS